MIRSISFRYKLLIGSAGLVVMTVAIMGFVNAYKMHDSLEFLGRAMLQNTVSQIVDTLDLQNTVIQDKLNTDLVYLEKEFRRYGVPGLDPTQPATLTITNQITKKSERVTIPSLALSGQSMVGNTYIVDMVQQSVGGTATIFQVLPGKLLRVATNVRKLDGERATGTYIPAESPVYKTIMRGETFRGRAFVVNDWYLTAYKPVKDSDGNIVAVLYVGRKIMTDKLREIVEMSNVVGKGYAFVFNDGGEVLVNPVDTIPAGSNLKDHPFGAAILETRGDVVRYEVNGDEHVAFVQAFDPWGWRVAMAIEDKNIMHGVDKQVVDNALISGGLALAVALAATFLASALLVRPLREAVSVARRIEGGDRQARIRVTNWDEIGQLGKAFNDLMDKMEDTLCEQEGYMYLLNSVKDPIFAVDEDFKFILANKATCDMAGKSEDELKNIRCSEVFNASVCGTPDCPIARARASQGRVEADLTEINVGGEVRYIKPTGDVMKDCNGREVGYLEVAKDVTEMVRNEHKLEENLSHIQVVNTRINEAGVQLSESMESMSSQVEQVRRGAELQSERMAETATAMEQMNATVIEVARNASSAAENATEVRDKAQAGEDAVSSLVSSIGSVRDRVAGLKEKMAELGGQAENIGHVMAVINDIADQTNLLALNAAIEAARAGEAGRGFAVVADEVRKLAEKTMSATSEVETAIGRIQTGARENVQATEEAAAAMEETTGLAGASGERLAEIMAIVEATVGQVQSIATAAEQQSASSEEINRSVEEVNRISAETSHGMSQAARSLEELARLAAHLKELASAED